MAGAVSNLMVRAGFDGSKLESGLKTMQGQVQGAHRSIGSTLGTIGKVTAAAVATVGASMSVIGGLIAKTGIAYDSMAENSQVAWNTLLGSQEKAKQMVKDISDFAKNTQFDTTNVDAMAKYMHNAGYEGKELFNRLTEIADVSGAFNIPADSAQELARQMSQVVQSGTAYTEDLNILQDRGVPIYKAIAEQLGVDVGAVKMLASQGKLSSDDYIAAFDNIAGSVKGASEAQSVTFTGMISTIKDQLSMLAGILAKPLFNSLKAGMDKLVPVLNSLVSYANGDVKDFSKTMDEAFGPGSGQKVMVFANGFKAVVDKIKNGISSLKTTFGGIAEIFKGGANEGTGISMLSRAGLDPEQIHSVTTAVDKIKKAMEILKGAFEIFKGDSIGGITFLTKMGFSPETITKVVHVVNGIKNAIGSFVSSYTGYIKGLFSGDGNLGQSFGKIFNTAKSIVMPILTDIVAFVKEKIAMIKQFWDENGAQIIQAVKNMWAVIAAIFKFIAPVILFVLKMLWDSVKGVIDGALKIIMGLIKVFAGLFTGDFSKMWEGIKQLFFGAIQFVWNLINLLMFGRILSGIKAFITGGITHFTGFWTKVVDIFKNLDTHVWNIAKGMISKVVSFFRGFVSEGVRIFDTLRTFGASKFQALWEAIKVVAKAIADSVVGNFKSLVTGAKHIIEGWMGAVKTNFNLIKDAIVNPIDTAKKLAVGIFGKIVDAAKNIPGGIVKGLKSGVGAITRRNRWTCD
jgi:tape measure domain-containing protein